MRLHLCGVAGLFVAALSVFITAAEKGAAPGGRIDFDRDIRPLLSDRCFRCHGPDAAKREAELRLDVRAGLFKKMGAGWAVVKPGDPAKSELVRRIFTDDIEDMMPPGDSNLSLADGEKALLKRWIAEGAAYKSHWSFAPVTAVAIPTRRAADASTNPIDAFVRARLDVEGVSPSPRASREVLLRRLAFNLTGLPPTAEQVASFAADDAPGAYERAVERFLRSPAYGERMAMDWLDLARYADTYGYQNDVERDMSPYRDWVIDTFNKNLSYDQFLTWQLAGDLLPNATREQRIATAFNRLHRQTNEGGSIEEEFRTEYVMDRVNTFGTSMLGLTLECARCHDHKFDPITQRDYYSLFAFFNNIDESGLYSHFTNATPSPSLLLWPPGKAREHQRLRGQILFLARLSSAHRTNVQETRSDPIAHLAFDSVTDKTTPDSVLAQEAELVDGPVAVGGALRFSGDNAVVHRGIPTFRRTDAFSLAIRLRPTERQDRAIILHQSRAWSDAGSRGFELTLDHGRPFFGLIHFWPGNAIAVRAVQPLPVDAWSHLVVTYDGSSRAAGIRLYLNGRPLASNIVRDRLFKDITYSKAAGDEVNEQPRFTIGARFRDSGFRNGLVDDLQVFADALTAAEASVIAGRQPLPSAAVGHFRARHHQPDKDVVAELQKLRAAESALIETVPEIMVMEEMRTVRPAYRLHRGAYDAPRELVPRDTPRSLPSFPPAQPRNRLGLARWLTARRNPLAARVAVNRIWRLHFGRGLVATPEDFGTQGRRPTHPELLDFLANRFIESGWDVKALHRLIVSSDTFQQSSSVSAARTAADPDNQLLARGPRRRLAAEEIRDAALAASGLMNRAIGGRSVKPYQPIGLWEQSGTGKTYKQDTGSNLYRRSLYTFVKRTSPPPSMITFDAGSREVCTARREPTATPLQALVLLNDPQFVEAARKVAETTLRRFPDDATARVRMASVALLARAPDDEETRILMRLFEEQQAIFAAQPSDAARLLTVGESPVADTLPRIELAAMTMVATALMNFDEFIVLR
jgi:uncharacterized protein DUF1553/uncharacterized protein DUF1549/concanavalin A-like lectin/glucanase superfamily protein/cytochrome c